LPGRTIANRFGSPISGTTNVGLPLEPIVILVGL